MRSRKRARGLAGLLLLGLLPAGGCDAPDSGEAQEPGTYSETRLRIDRDPAEVLATIDGEAAITVGHFNDRLIEFAVEDQRQDLAVARRQVLDEMIDYQLIVREGRRRHPEMAADAGPEKGPYYTQRLLAQTVIRESATNPDLASDEEAREFLREEQGALQRLIEKTPSPEERLLIAKVGLLDQRWRAQLRAWRSEHDIEISEEKLGGEVDS
jgi:hypothetical protein